MFHELLHHSIQRVSQPFPHCIFFEIYGKQGRNTWLFSAHPQYPRVGPTEKNFAKPRMPPIFCLWLRTRLINAEFVQVESLHDRVTQWTLARQDEQYFLVWEENGKASNLLLLDANRNLLMALFNPNQAGRILKQEMPYSLPTHWNRPFTAPDIPFDALQRDAWYWQLELEGNVAERKTYYQKHFKALRKKLTRRLGKQEQDLANCQQAEQYRQWGELLKPHLHEIQSGQSEIQVTNYFDENLDKLTIPLKPEWTPHENLEHFFQKSDKLENAVPHVEMRILETIEEQDLLKSQTVFLQKVSDWKSFREWEKQLPGFLKPRLSMASKQTRDSGGSAEPMTRISSDGLVMVIGRNQHQNAQVTFSIARGNDWWFHAQGIPGSHVIVKYPKTPLPSNTLHEAAQLAAYYCKSRASRRIEIDYTQRKHVRKIKGAAPGTVTYAHNKSILVELDDVLIDKLLGSIR